MDYFEQLRQGGPGYAVREISAFNIYCRDQDSNSEVLAFQSIVRDAKANEDGDWEVKLAPPGGFTGRSIPGWQSVVYLMAAIAKQ